MNVVDIVEIGHPEAAPDICLQAAALILEIGNYKQTRDVDMILGGMAGRTTVAALDGYEQVVGTAGLLRVRNNPVLGVLEDVVADPRKRGQGIGRKVVEAVEAIAVRHGILELNFASSAEAVPFYNHLGYTQLGERTFRKFL